MEELVSVIIPVYNVEKYLNRCVRSIRRQTYKNLEIILVDDGSPDGSGAMCDRFAAEDSRIKVIHKENGGLSDARNCGVASAAGNYIVFLDSDDYVAENHIEFLYQSLIENGADIATCGRILSSEEEIQFPRDAAYASRLLTGTECVKAIFSAGGDLYADLVTACWKIYKRSILDAARFPVGHKHEDEAVMPIFFYAAKKVFYTNNPLYCYYQNPDSIMHSRGTGKNLDVIYAFRTRAEYFEAQNEPGLAQLAWGRLYSYLIADSIRNSGRCDGELAEYITKDRVPGKVYLRYLLYRACPGLFRSLWMRRHKS